MLRASVQCALLLSLGSLAGAPVFAGIVSEVKIAPAFFNPAIGQKQVVKAKVSEAGTLALAILDRDRFPIRTMKPQPVEPGTAELAWDGRDDAGELVPDEAYNLVLKFVGAKGSETYDPSAGFRSHPADAKINFYSREDGILSYTLASASRVHAQAGQSRVDPVSKKRTDVILKTLVDSAPRVAGAVIEKWNGIDAGGTIAVPQLPDFVVAVLALPLPENAMITIGNRKETFPAYALRHRPAGVTKPRDLSHAMSEHHAGLNALEDRTPRLELKPSADWDQAARSWTVRRPLTVRVDVERESAAFFLSQPNDLSVLVDGTVVFNAKQPGSPVTVEIPSSSLPAGKHLVAFNWASRLGPVAVNAMEVVVPSGSTGAGAEGGQ